MVYYDRWYYPALEYFFGNQEYLLSVIISKVAFDTLVHTPIVEAPIAQLWYMVRPAVHEWEDRKVLHPDGNDENSTTQRDCFSFKAGLFDFMIEKWLVTCLASALIWVPGTSVLFLFPLQLQVYASIFLGTLEVMAFTLIAEKGELRGLLGGTSSLPMMVQRRLSLSLHARVPGSRRRSVSLRRHHPTNSSRRRHSLPLPRQYSQIVILRRTSSE